MLVHNMCTKSMFFIIICHFQYQTYEVISALILAYKAAASTPATGRMAEYIWYQRSGQ